MQIFSEYLGGLPSENNFHVENNFIVSIVKFFDLVFPVYEEFENSFVLENENISDVSEIESESSLSDLLAVFNDKE